MQSRKGFTLIELLVVIAIIAILAAILFPVFTAAKGRAQQASCMSNMKELAQAVYNYLGDFDDTYPMNRFRDPLMPGDEMQPMNGTRYNWKTALFPYVKTRNDIWRCRSNPNRNFDDETGTWTGFPPEAEVPKFPVSYAYNGEYFQEFVGVTYELEEKKMSQIRKPTKLILICESRMWFPDVTSGMLSYANWDGYVNYKTGKTVQGTSNLNIHYSGLTNFVFADTHCVAMKVKPTLTPTSMWNPANQSEHDKIAAELPPECD